MSAEERDAYLQTARTCRVATSGSDGAPHVSALWFVWLGEAIWLYSIVNSQRWTNLMRDPRISILVDDGHDFTELRGIEILGRGEVIGEVPRTGVESNSLLPVESAFGAKYSGGSLAHDGRHAWVKVAPEKIVSWDFGKTSQLSR